LKQAVLTKNRYIFLHFEQSYPYESLMNIGFSGSYRINETYTCGNGEKYKKCCLNKKANKT